MSNAFLRLENLSKHYAEAGQQRAVLNQLNLHMGAGEFVALLGSSGCGKSTLLNLIAGIDQVDYGSIWIADTELSALDEQARTLWRRQHIGFVFQFFNLIPTLTVFENVRLPLQLNTMDTSEHQQRARQLLDQVGLAGREHSFPEQLSGGEQQRLALVRALIHSPSLLLADEPTGNLDSETGVTVLGILSELTRQMGTSVLMVTHSELAAQYAERVLIMENGHLRE